MIVGTAETILSSKKAAKYKGKVQLVFTSPPFPLNRKKKYGNLQGGTVHHVVGADVITAA